MEESILTSTKKVLGFGEDYDVFDLDILTHINSALSTLHQLGIGPSDGLVVEDDQAVWDDIDETPVKQNMIRAYVYLKVRLAFDPPAIGFHLDSMKNQIAEHEGRLSIYREEELT